MFNKALLVATVATVAFSSAAFAGKIPVDAFKDRNTVAVSTPAVTTDAKPAKTMHKAKKAGKTAAKKSSK